MTLGSNAMSQIPSQYTLVAAMALLAPCSCNEPAAPDTSGSSGGSLQASGGTGGSTGDDPTASGGRSGGGTHSSDSGGSSSAGSGGAAANAGGADPAGSGGAGTSTSVECLSVAIVGRHEGCEQGVNMAWSGTGFRARFTGTGLRITQSGSAVQYTVLVDGQLTPNLETTSGEQTYTVVAALPQGEHDVEVYRRGEASFGVTTLLDVEAIDGDLLPPPPSTARRIEIYGDSISCGYGNEGTSTDCPFSADTENHYLTYGAILARAFDAELSTIAWSGKGVVVNYNGDTSTTLPEMAERALPESDRSVWDYALVPHPHAVLINLGTNDMSTDNDPTHETFVAGYAQFLEGLRARYPDALIVGTVGPMLNGEDLDKARAGIEAAVERRNDQGDQKVLAFELQTGNPDSGCDWHPNLSTHEAMADELSSLLSEELGW